MPFSLGPVLFGMPAGLWALVSLVPLIALYLIRPKPKHLQVPSLMFFFHNTGRSRLSNFLKQITKDWLFLLQLLLLLLLALANAQPSTTVQHDITAKNTVIVLDVSASSQVREGLQTRFEIGVERARKALGSRNTIILAKDVPLIGVQDVSANEALTFLSTIKPRDTSTRLGDAIILAGEVLNDKEGRVIVISDFVNTGGIEPSVARSVLQARHLVVDFIPTSSGVHRRNIGITGLDVRQDSTTVFLRNYEPADESALLNAGSFSKQVVIPASGTETVSFETPPGKTIVNIGVSDDFSVDNRVFMSAPGAGKLRVLYITSNASVFLVNAFKALPGVELTIAELPIVPKGEFDVFVLQNIDDHALLAGTLEDIKTQINAGKVLIIHAQPDSPAIDYKGLLPVKLGERGAKAPVVVVNPTRFTQGLDFSKVDEFFKAAVLDSHATTVLSAFDQPLLTVESSGKGRIAWFGMLEHASDFKYSPDYPIFWNEFIKFLAARPDVRSLNLRTKDSLILSKPESIRLPDGSRLVQSSIVVERAGFYELSDRTVAANLLDDAESAINPSSAEQVVSGSFELRPVREPRKYALETILLWFVFCLVILELVYVKLRGDI